MPGIPPELMKLMGGAGGAPGAGGPPQPGMPGAGAGGMPPTSAPMSTPQDNAGEKQAAKVRVQQAMDLLELSLPELGSESPEGIEVIKCLSVLGKKFGGADRARSKELMPAEIMNLVASLPHGAGGMKPPQPGAGGPPGGGMPPMPPMQ